MKFNLLTVFAFILIAVTSCTTKGGDTTEKKQKPPVAVDVLIAEEGEFDSDIEVNGTVLSEEMVELHPEVSGRLTFLNIPDGVFVKEGTVLAKINDADLQAQLQQQKVQLQLAEKTEERLRQLLSAKGVDQATYDAALSQVNLINANINVLRAQIDKTVIKAPFSGRLGLRLVSEGAYISPSVAIGTLQQTDKVKIDFAVPEAYADLLKTGRTVGVRANGGAANLKATISAIEPQINTATRNIKVRARLETGTLNAGAFVKVLLNDRKSGIVVPSNAVIPDALSNQVVIVKGGKAVFQNVEIGIRNSDVVEIVNGLQVNDTVIVSGVLYVRPNSVVQIKKVIPGLASRVME
ncbi:MAG: efflux RND transporter periplasmic adaptor subunit [Lentimicrobiaceae bacterium]|nr:efflux RND transporter periplasmic adaptor subunit [Lentimicrobiaceae bacterium]MCB9024448.1 efflux RND transporter periplasmic adaptor subunit [Lentimicrobiaceae bacterium]